MADTAVRTLLITRSSPYAGHDLRDALDAALAFCTFEQPVSVLFCGNAASVTLPNQEPGQGKVLAKICCGLRELGVESLYLEDAALTALGLDVVPEGFQRLEREQTAALIAAHDCVLSL